MTNFKILIILIGCVTMISSHNLKGRFLVIGDIHYDPLYLENSSPGKIKKKNYF